MSAAAMRLHHFAGAGARNRATFVRWIHRDEQISGRVEDVTGLP